MNSLKNIPDIKSMMTGDAGGEDHIKKIYHDAILSPEDEIEKPEIVFGVADERNGDVWVGSKGNISLLKGPQKSRKTFATSAICAAVTGNVKSITFRSYLPGPARVLYVDTEQGKYDCKKVLRRMMEVSGLELDHFKKYMTFLTLRPFSPSTRREVIKYALSQIGDKLSLLVIDGIRDLVTDINDSTESTGIVTDLMAWSADYNIHILNVLHENKSNQNARGHLGTELQNKCEAVFRVSKLDQDDNYSIIQSESMRGMSFDPIVFEIVENKNEIGIPTLAEDVEVETKDNKSGKSKNDTSGLILDSIPQATHIECIRACYVNEQGMFDTIDPLSAREFNRRIKKAFGDKDIKVSDHKARDLAEYYLNQRILRDLNEDTDTKSKKLIPGFDDELPF